MNSMTASSVTNIAGVTVRRGWLPWLRGWPDRKKAVCSRPGEAINSRPPQWTMFEWVPGVSSYLAVQEVVGRAYGQLPAWQDMAGLSR